MTGLPDDNRFLSYADDTATDVEVAQAIEDAKVALRDELGEVIEELGELSSFLKDEGYLDGTGAISWEPGEDTVFTSGPPGPQGPAGPKGSVFDDEGSLTGANQSYWNEDENTVYMTGPAGPQGPAATITMGTVYTNAPGTQAAVSNTGTSGAAVLNFYIPAGVKGDKGDKGDPGAAGPAGEASVFSDEGTLTGANQSYWNPSDDTVYLTGPAGAQGPAATIAVGTTTTLAAGSQASVTNSGTSGAAVFNFSIPRGATGPAGTNGTDAQVTSTNVINALGYTPLSTTGNAASAAKLQTARTINGVAFDGTANITLPAGAATDNTKLPLAGGTLTGDVSGLRMIMAGTAAAPGFAFTTATSTGMYPVSSTSLGFTFGGVNRLTINNGDFVSLGSSFSWTSTSVGHTIGFVPVTKNVAANRFDSIFGTNDNNGWAGIVVGNFLDGANNSQKVSIRTGRAGVATDRIVVNPDGMVNLYMTGGGGNLRIYEGSATATQIQQFYLNNVYKGNVEVNSGGTGFNSVSDYRLKGGVVDLDDGAERVKLLAPRRFYFLDNPDHVIDGFIAHEVAGAVPNAVSGEKDAVDAEGNPKYQTVDNSRLVPVLTAALQEAIARIEELERKFAEHFPSTTE